jgi:hypothetical protein
MNNKIVNGLIYSVLILAMIGFLVSLFSEPLQLIGNILITIIIVAVIYFVFRYFAVSRSTVQPVRRASSGTNDQKAYLNAVRYSKKRVKKKQRPKQQPDKLKQALRRQNAPQLTVIEGKKNKKRNRALH